MQWYSECVNSHSRCKSPLAESDWLPTRVLDLSGVDKMHIRLCITAKDHYSGRYLTLSHRWGGSEVIKLTSLNIADFQKGISLNDLPQTYKEAIEVARRLSIRYIWIGSLCIIQDSDEDWQMEAAMMENVYGNSHLNIMAAASENGQGGLFRHRDPRYLRLCTVPTKWIGLDGQTLAIFDQDMWNTELSEAPLNRRSWVLQERIMAPRVLHFGERQLFWECMEREACETYPERLPTLLSSGSPRMKVIDPELYTEYLPEFASNYGDDWGAPAGYKIWARIVKKYFKGKLTNERDKLVALSGLAKIMRSKLKDKYLAGLWLQYLPSQLVWLVGVLQASRELPYRRTKYRAPTWSWASVEAEVHCFTGNDDGAMIKVVDASTIPIRANDETGQLSGGMIRLEGIVIQARLFTVFNTRRSLKLIIDNTTLATEIYLDEPCWPIDITLYCLLVVSRTEGKHEYKMALLLQHAKDHPQGWYERFGTVHIHRFDDRNEVARNGWKYLNSIISSGKTDPKLYLEKDAKQIILV